MGVVTRESGRSSALERLTSAILGIRDRSQRVGLSRDLLGSDSEEERRLSVEDRCARARHGDSGLWSAIKRVIAEADALSERLPERSFSDILLGGLVIADLLEGQA